NRVGWHQSEFSALIDNLVTGKIDLIAAGMFITPERAGRVNFSEPTFHVQQSMLVLNGNPLDIHSYQQAVLNKARVAVISEAVEGIWLQNLGLQPNNLISVPNALTGKLSVETGISDALALSSPTIHWISMHDDTGKTEVAIPFDQVAINGQKYQGYGAFAFRQQDQQLLKAWNEQLKTYVGSPDHLKLISEFGFTADELPGKTTTEEIIRGK
ncbi:MAG: transporter substrate-binding domain-containing protein, partial [Anaerolineae bacterium]|nr:transporter substrate-binding domain-containing protein [Anaerolineae bacterium]